MDSYDRCLSSANRYYSDPAWYYPAMYPVPNRDQQDYPSPAPSDPSPGPRPHQQLDYPTTDPMAPPFSQIDSSIGPTRVSRRQSSLKQGLLSRRPSLSSSYSRDPSIQDGIIPRVDSPSSDRYGDRSSLHSTSPHLASVQLLPPYHPGTPTSMASPYSPYEHARRSRTRSTSNFDPRAHSPALSTNSAHTSFSSYGVDSTARAESSKDGANRPKEKEKHHKHRLRDVDRKNICLHHINYPNARQEDIGGVFGVERSTISKILKEKDKWLNISEEDESNEQTAKHRPSKFPEIEEEMRMSLQAWSDLGTNITDQLIRHRALEIAKSFHITPEKFKGSSGWIENFKHRHEIRRGEWLRASKLQPLPSSYGPSTDHRGGVPPTPVLMAYDQQRMDAATESSSQESQYKAATSQAEEVHTRLPAPWAHASQDVASQPPMHVVPAAVIDPSLQSDSSQSSLDSTHQHHQQHQHQHEPPEYLEHHQHHQIVEQPPEQHHQPLEPTQHSPVAYTVDPYAQPMYVPPMPNMRPSFAEAEEAINVLITYLETSGQTYILPNERKAVQNIKCAMFQHASGLEYERID